MLNLQEKGVVGTKFQESQQIKIGDVVILREDGTAHSLWKLTKVIELLKGRDNMIRSARVQVLSKEKVTELRRPIQHLIPYEAS